MNTKRKIAVIGCGSQFSVGLTESIIDYARDRLPSTEIVLLDIHPEHLQIVRVMRGVWPTRLVSTWLS